MIVRNFRSRINYCVKVFLFLFLIINLAGCEAFVRKFTRKSKKDKFPEKDIVLVPEEYKSNMTKEEQYRQYFVFWKSWQDELIAALVKGGSYKRQIDCTEEAIKNLVSLRALLIEEKQNKIGYYINRLNSLKEAISQDIYGYALDLNRQTAERIRRNILRDFSYNKIKGCLK